VESKDKNLSWISHPSPSLLPQHSKELTYERTGLIDLDGKELSYRRNTATWMLYVHHMVELWS